jgi:hypothetical protein
MNILRWFLIFTRYKDGERSMQSRIILSLQQLLLNSIDGETIKCEDVDNLIKNIENARSNLDKSLLSDFKKLL